MTAAKYPWPKPVNEAGFPKEAGDLQAAEPGAGQAYIQALLEVAAGDAKNYTVTATLEVGAIVFLLKDSIATVKSAAPFLSWVALFAIITLAVSAAGFYVFAVRINSTRAFIARTLANNDPFHARELWVGEEYGLRKRYGIYRSIGFWLMGFGAAAVAFTAAWLLLD